MRIDNLFDVVEPGTKIIFRFFNRSSQRYEDCVIDSFPMFWRKIFNLKKLDFDFEYFEVNSISPLSHRELEVYLYETSDE